MNEQKLFAVSIVLTEDKPTSIYILNKLLMVTATSRDEAIGMAIKDSLTDAERGSIHTVAACEASPQLETKAKAADTLATYLKLLKGLVVEQKLSKKQHEQWVATGETNPQKEKDYQSLLRFCDSNVMNTAATMFDQPELAEALKAFEQEETPQP